MAIRELAGCELHVFQSHAITTPMIRDLLQIRAHDESASRGGEIGIARAGYER